MSTTILTDGHGRPFAEEDVLVFLRTSTVRNDAVASAASRAFERQFRRAVCARR